MGGENEMNIGFTIEILFDFIQQVTFIGFLYLFFDKPKSKTKRVLPFCITVLLMFVLSIYFTTIIDNQFSFIDPLIVVSIMIIYSLLFLKGKIYLRIIIPITIVALYAVVVYLIQFAISVFGNTDFEETLIQSSFYRYLYLSTGNFVFNVFLFIIYRFGKGKTSINSIPDVLSFVVVPIISCAICIAALSAFKLTAFSDRIQLYFAVIIIGIAVMTSILWFLFFRISKDSRVKAELLLSTQREELYRKSVISTNIQIERLSEIKHDINNHLMSASELISNGEYEKAKEICDNVSRKLTSAYTPIHTENPVLNAILNVEIEKAVTHRIDFRYDIQNSLLFVTDSDIISIIGNICDNAIEYLITIPESKRQMSLAITVYRDYYCVTCKNIILTSVINTNPNLNSTKEDLTFHGKGTKILKDIAEKYSGKLIYSEEDGWFIISAIIRNKN